MDALAACLELQPSAVELMDHMLLELTAGNLALRDTMTAIRRPAAGACSWSSSAATTTARWPTASSGCGSGCTASPALTALVPALDPAVRDPLWNLRQAAMPLLYGMPGDRKPVTFVEDTAVAPERLPEFVARFRETAAAATAPTAPSTATPASAACTSGRC